MSNPTNYFWICEKPYIFMIGGPKPQGVTKWWSHKSSNHILFGKIIRIDKAIKVSLQAISILSKNVKTVQKPGLTGMCLNSENLLSHITNGAIREYIFIFVMICIFGKRLNRSPLNDNILFVFGYKMHSSTW